MEADDWDARYAEQDLLWSAEANRFVIEHLSDLRPGTAIDLAAGEGRNAIWLAGRGWTVTAVDFSPVALAKARRLADHHEVDVDWVVADLTTFAPPPGGFDLVLVAYLQLPAPELAGVLERAAAAVAPGGTFLLVAHDRRNLTDGVGGPQHPAVLTRADEVVPHLTGLTVAEAGEVERPVETEEGPRTAIDTLVLAHRDPSPR